MNTARRLSRLSAFALALVAGVGSLAGVAHAQLGGGRSGMSTSDRLSNVNAFTDLSNFGRCYANANRATVHQIMATVPGSPEEAEIFRRVLDRRDQNCLFGGTNTTASLIYFRGVFVEGLLRGGGELPATLVQSALSLDAVGSLPDAARCYVGSHRDEATALLLTRLGSEGELAAVTALWPNMRACIPAATRFRVNAPWIRFLIAEALLRVPAGSVAAGAPIAIPAAGGTVQ